MLARDPLGSLTVMKLTEWLDGYRRFRPDEVVRTVAEPENDWEEPELIASDDRRRSTEPRWLERASHVGYGRPTQI
jgi:hypothetical protein